MGAAKAAKDEGSKAFDEWVERERAKEVADEWGKTRGSGKKSTAQEKVKYSASRMSSVVPLRSLTA